MLFISKKTASKFYLVVFFGLSVVNAHANPKSQPFNVTVTLDSPANPKSAFCRSSNIPGSFGATVTVVCSTQALVDVSPSKSAPPLQSLTAGYFSYIFQANRESPSMLNRNYCVNNIDDGARNINDCINKIDDIGREVSWQSVKLAGLEYIEILVNW